MNLLNCSKKKSTGARCKMLQRIARFSNTLHHARRAHGRQSKEEPLGDCHSGNWNLDTFFSRIQSVWRPFFLAWAFRGLTHRAKGHDTTPILASSAPVQKK
jgi:hypothetical protein